MAGNSHEGHKKVTLCSESELELTIDQLIKDVQTRCGLGGGTWPNTLSGDLETPNFKKFLNFPDHINCTCNCKQHWHIDQ